MTVRVHRPRTLEELCFHLSEGAQLLGGGTLLIPRWSRSECPPAAVTLDRIPLARQVSPTYVGAAVTLGEVVNSEAPAALRAASRSIGTSYLRGQATVGGNIGSEPPGCLLTVLAGLEARALVLYGGNGREASMSVEEARVTGSVVLGLEWKRPDASRYRKLRTGRAGPTEFAVALTARDHRDGIRLTAAVWASGSVTVATTVLAIKGSDGLAAQVVALLPHLASWEQAVVEAEIEGLLTDHAASAPALGGHR
jgi:CO/xanthine dehydrogenase FAD-binding subunit